MLVRIMPLILICSALPALLFAHGTGASWEVTVGDQLVDIGYSSEPFEVGAQHSFDFTLTRLSDKTPVPFTDVWMRVAHEEKTIFSAPINNSALGGARATLVFPEKGTYVMAVHYYNAEGEELAKAEIPFSVIGATGSSNTTVFTLVTILLAFCGGGIIGYMGKRRFI